MPGNGIEPKYLAGRDEYLESFARSLQSFEHGLPRNTVLSGLRGTGKTVLLRRFKIVAESKDWLTVEREFNARFSDENTFAEAIVKDIVTKATDVSLANKLKKLGKRMIDTIKPEELDVYGITYKPFYKEARKELLEDYLKEILVKNRLILLLFWTLRFHPMPLIRPFRVINVVIRLNYYEGVHL